MSDAVNYEEEEGPQMPRDGCCVHCETVNELMRLIRKVDARQDAQSIAMAKLLVDFRLVRQLVYGAAAVMLTATLGFAGQAVATAVASLLK